MKSLHIKINQSVNSYNAPSPAEPLFHYTYGKDHWQNLCDHEKDGQLPFEERNKYFKLLWVDEEPTFNQYSAIETIKYDGELLILASSKISDATYQYKFETHIENLKALAYDFQEKLSSDCDGWLIKAWRIVEVENIYDNNLDGVKVRFTIQNKA
ncbi:hypothetical protein [Flavobacterium sp.]|uniref:hypothetical protein n=1 Tax=Flavobacterium sp. TaxID=239 RepID=UPI002602CBB9|nr:hypothetical protein [Flavobacterium sp.]